MEDKGVRLVIISGKPYIVPAVIAETPDLLEQLKVKVS